MYEEPTIVDLVKDKSGAELFKELYRLLPSLSFEDYFKNGIWQNDMMRLDIEVIDAHRKEAGAPAPPPMEEIEFPPLPGHANSLGGLLRALVPAPGLGAAAMLVRPAGMNGVPGAEGAAGELGEAVPGQGLLAAPSPKMPATSGAPPLDMKVIALFVSKWKLDPTRAKTALEKLTPTRRRFVMQNFKHIPINGSSSSDKLEEYIAQCEQTGSWDVVAEAATSVPGDSAGGVKRPAEQSDESSKRQNTGPASAKVPAASKAAAKATAAKS
mmetsp:Transcript_51902/g.116375  ORF Transcript_51902/g.116375 Transcript_51902/m.116375 type:complete len:269 (-) Transcript_51902:60-866(-)